MTEAVVERFSPSSGRITGITVLVTVAAIVAFSAFDRESGFSAPVVAGSLAAGVIAWAAMLRPQIWVTERDLVLRNMFETVSVPLGAIEEIVIRQVLAVRAGGERYVSPAIGRSRRDTIKSGSSTGAGSRHAPARVAHSTTSYPDFVETRIRQLAEDARAQLGITPYSDEQVALALDAVRRPAWIERVALGVTLVAFVVTLFW